MSQPTGSSEPAGAGTFKATKQSALNPTTKKLITIMLVGETGSGKTTFMSLLVNLFQGNEALELVDKNDPSKESGLEVSKSQTTKATLYTVRSLDGTQLRILDTPGLADTEGVDRDNQHLQEINNAIGSYQLDQIDAVHILANGRNERLSVSTEYTLGIIAALFPHTVTENIGFILTNCDNTTANFKINLVQEELRKSECWYIDNPLAILKKFQREQESGEVNNTTKRKYIRKIESTYDDAVDELNKWLEWLDKRIPQATKAIRDLYETATLIESKISVIVSNMDTSRAQSQELQDARAKLKNSKNVKDTWEELQRKQTKPYWDQELTEQRNTICNTPDCHRNCHTPCMTVGKLEPARCLRFSRSQGTTARCDECGHLASQHRQMYAIHIQRVHEPDPNTVKELNNATTDEEKYRALDESLTKKIDELTKATTDALAKMHELVDEFNRLSLSKNFAGHINSTIDLLKARKEKLAKEPDTEKDREMIDSTLEKLRKKLMVIQGSGGPNE